MRREPPVTFSVPVYDKLRQLDPGLHAPRLTLAHPHPPAITPECV